MKVNKLAKMAGAQDGAIWGDFLFRFGSTGQCRVYELEQLTGGDTQVAEIASFWLDKASILAPHSNAVAFGSAFYSPEDEFPLLYSNIYNNYSSCEERFEGVCCVYRLKREGKRFSSSLVQLIEIGFVRNSLLWCSGWEKGDVRPYGNFAIDRENQTLFAFTMRDEARKTRYFSFRLPQPTEGSMDDRFGVRKVTLTPEDILASFDCEYHHYLQGACVHDGLLYSVEGFTGSKENPPVLRIIDPEKKMQTRCFRLEDEGLAVEPEFIDFKGDVCYYSDGDGNLFTLVFDE